MTFAGVIQTGSQSYEEYYLYICLIHLYDFFCNLYMINFALMFDTS